MSFHDDDDDNNSDPLNFRTIFINDYIRQIYEKAYRFYNKTLLRKLMNFPFL